MNNFVLIYEKKIIWYNLVKIKCKWSKYTNREYRDNINKLLFLNFLFITVFKLQYINECIANIRWYVLKHEVLKKSYFRHIHIYI